eukprot:4992654-Pyramimonas_sp.AAC.1
MGTIKLGFGVSAMRCEPPNPSAPNPSRRPLRGRLSHRSGTGRRCAIGRAALARFLPCGQAVG